MMRLTPDPEILARIRAQRVDFVVRLLLARSDGAFDTELAGELADLLAQAPDVQIYHESEEVT